VIFICLQLAIGFVVSGGSRSPVWATFAFALIFYAYARKSENTYKDWRQAAVVVAGGQPNYLRGAAVFGVLLIALFIPVSIDHLVNGAGANLHVVSYFIGPSLYEKFANVVPGVDYHTHYSQLAGYLFKFLVADTVLDTYRNYVWMMLVVVLLYYVSAFLFSAYALRDIRYAIVVTMLAFILNFQTDHSHFFGPTAWPVRFFLLNLVGFAVCRLVCEPADKLRQLALGGLLALALLEMSETGLYMVFACMVTGLLLMDTYRSLWSTFLRVLAAFLIVFYATSILLFGTSAFTIAYHSNLIEALVLYSVTGWVSVPMKWVLSWPLVYNLLLPALLLSTIVAMRLADLVPKATRSTIMFCSLMGLLLHLKWINTSHDAVVHQSILVSLIVVGWLVRLASVDARSGGNRGRSRVIVALGVIGGIALITTVNDPRQGKIPTLCGPMWSTRAC